MVVDKIVQTYNGTKKNGANALQTRYKRGTNESLQRGGGGVLQTFTKIQICNMELQNGNDEFWSLFSLQFYPSVDFINLEGIITYLLSGCRRS